MNFHKHSLFPFVVVLLSSALVLFVVLNFIQTNTDGKFPSVFDAAVEERGPALTEDEYKIAADLIIDTFKEQFGTTSDSTEETTIVDAAISDLLVLVIPVSMQPVHLEFVLSLNMIRRSITENDEILYTQGFDRLTSIIEVNDWLK